MIAAEDRTSLKELTVGGLWCTEGHRRYVAQCNEQPGVMGICVCLTMSDGTGSCHACARATGACWKVFLWKGERRVGAERFARIALAWAMSRLECAHEVARNDPPDRHWCIQVMLVSTFDGEVAVVKCYSKGWLWKASWLLRYDWPTTVLANDHLELRANKETRSST